MIWSYFLATDSNTKAKLGGWSIQGTPLPPKSRRGRWKWARWPDAVMCSYIDVTPHCNIQPHSPGCTWEEMTRGCGLDNVQPVKRRDITKAVLHTGDRHKDWKRSVAKHFATSKQLRYKGKYSKLQTWIKHPVCPALVLTLSDAELQIDMTCAIFLKR